MIHEFDAETMKVKQNTLTISLQLNQIS